MNWKQIINFNQFKRYTKQNIDEKYILITHREINTRLKRLSKVHCLYISNERYLLPEKIYKNGNFNNNIIYNYLQFNNQLYRICSRGCFSIYTKNNYIDINEIKDKELLFICKHYYNHNQIVQDILSFLIYDRQYTSNTIYLINNDFSIWPIYSYHRKVDKIFMPSVILSEMNIYIISLNTEYLIIYYSNKVFKIIFNNDIFINNDINILAKHIYKLIDIKVDITLDYIYKIFNTIKAHQLIKNL